MHSYVTRRQNGEGYEEELEKDFEESLSLSVSLFERIYLLDILETFILISLSNLSYIKVLMIRGTNLKIWRENVFLQKRIVVECLTVNTVCCAFC